MKLMSFRIFNYCSIIDSSNCRISDLDGITVLAGQNESGKSSVLKALRDFEEGDLDENSIREESDYPVIQCTYSAKKKEIMKILKDEIVLDSDYYKLFEGESKVLLIRDFNEDDRIRIGGEIVDKIADCFESKQSVNENSTKDEDENDEDENEEEVYSLDEILFDIGEAIFNHTPKILFFDDFCDLLPDQILISDLESENSDAKGYQAVRNIEKLLGGDLVSFDGYGDAKLKRTSELYGDKITTEFNEKWRQRFGGTKKVKIHFHYNAGRKEDASYIKFFVETKNGELLPPRQRSQGFRWFLSFYLHLKAESERRDNIILFDEPGLHLHSKAQDDMIQVFEELSKNNQIIYSTHSPYLIDTDKLNRIRLIINTPKEGTVIEKITSDKISQKTDALKPIIDAMGMKVAHNFSIVKNENVIVEGISDFYYFTAMKKLLEIQSDFSFLPSMGASNVHLLMELCIGWGLNWLIVFDEKGSRREIDKIRSAFYKEEEEELQRKIYVLENAEGIEDLFTPDDLKLVNNSANFSEEELNSVVVTRYGGKELYGRLFLEKVNKEEVTIDNLSDTAIENFREAFEFIERGLS